MAYRKKALVFYTYLPPWRIDIFNEMSKYYDQTIVFTNLNAKGFTYNTVELLERLISPSIRWNYGFDTKRFSFRFGILYLLKKYKPEIVFTHEFGPTSVILAIFKFFKLLDFELIITTSDNLSIVNSHGVIKLFFRNFILKNSDGIVVYLESVKYYYQSLYPEKRIEVCPNIQNPKTLLSQANLGLPSGKDLPEEFILFVGRLEYSKGIDLLIKAFAGLENSKLSLIIIGKGSLKSDLLNLANTLNLMHRIEFVSEAYGYELYKYYKKAKLLVLPSRHEPFGAVINESLVFGCPVLVSKYAGAKSFVQNGFNGFITDPDNFNIFQRDLIYALRHFERRGDQSLMIEDFSQNVKAFKNISAR